MSHHALPPGAAKRYRWLTPPGPAAIAVVRCTVLPALIDRPLPEPGRARFATVRDPAGAVVDEAVVLRLDQEWIEVDVHGGPGVRAAVTACLHAHGMTEESEDFTDQGERRWAALAGAPSPAAARWLLRSGAAAPPFNPDFLRRPPLVLIAGPANAGKSTLLNAWCGRERALVSDVPGTTRDLVAAHTLVGGWRLRLLDSAGLRATDDPLEAAGQALVAQARGWADLVLFLASPAGAGDVQPSAGDLVVAGKADLRPAQLPGVPHWSALGAAGASADELLGRLNAAVLARLSLPAIDG